MSAEMNHGGEKSRRMHRHAAGGCVGLRIGQLIQRLDHVVQVLFEELGGGLVAGGDGVILGGDDIAELVLEATQGVGVEDTRVGGQAPEGAVFETKG